MNQRTTYSNTTNSNHPPPQSFKFHRPMLLLILVTILSKFVTICMTGKDLRQHYIPSSSSPSSSTTTRMAANDTSEQSSITSSSSTTTTTTTANSVPAAAAPAATVNPDAQEKKNVPSSDRMGNENDWWDGMGDEVVEGSSSSSSTSTSTNSTFSTGWDNNVGTVNTTTSTSVIIATTSNSTIMNSMITTTNNKKNNKNDNNHDDERPRIVFMHIGKTGGGTIRNKHLYFGCHVVRKVTTQRTCYEELKLYGPGYESALSKYTQGIYHYNGKFGTKRYTNEYTDVLFSIREPISRFKSWYEYVSPHNCNVPGKSRKQQCDTRKKAHKDKGSYEYKFWYECFPTVDEMIVAINPNNHKYAAINNSTTHTNGTECQSFLSEAFTYVGLGRFGHLTTGYRFYLQLSKIHQQGRLELQHTNTDAKMETKRVWAIRTEYLWDDMKTIDLALGGTGDFGQLVDESVTHIKEKDKKINITKAERGDDDDTSTLVVGNTNTTKTIVHNDDGDSKDDDSMIHLCCALLPEFDAYRTIVGLSTNLQPQTKVETYQLSWRKCNVSDWDDLDARCANLKLSFT